MNPSSGQVQHRRSLGIAALLTCFGTPLAWWLWFLVLGVVEGRSVSLANAASTLMVLGFVYGPLCAVSMGLVGLPLAYWMRRRGLLNSSYVCVAALLAGAAVGAFVSPPREIGEFMPIGAVTGLVSGVIFCLLGGIRLLPASVRH